MAMTSPTEMGTQTRTVQNRVLEGTERIIHVSETIDKEWEGRVIDEIIYRILLTVSSTSWMAVIFGIKEILLLPDPFHVKFLVGAVTVLIATAAAVLILLRRSGQEEMKDLSDCVLADQEFLPVYLGYCFVALSVDRFSVFTAVFLIVSVFVYLTQSCYFNLTLLFLGYHFYHGSTSLGTKLFLIVKGKIIRNVQGIEITGLRRINNITYLEIKHRRKRAD